MTHQPKLDPRHGRRPRGRQWTAILSTLVACLAVAACGSSSTSNSSSASSSAAPAAATSSSAATSASGATSAAGGSTSAAAAALQPYMKLPTSIGLTTPLKAAPPKGKTIVMLGTNNPSNVLIQQGMAKMAALAHWNYSLVSYDPANPGTFNSALTSALAKHPQYLVEAGLPLTSSQLSQAKNAGAKWIFDSVYPATIAPPVLADVDAFAQDALMGKIIADFFVSDSKGKGNAVIEHVPAYPILNGFTEGFQKEVKAQCPACKTSITNLTIPDLVAGKVPSTMVSALRSNPSANYVVSDDGPFFDGLTSALSGAGLAGKVKVIGEAADQAGIAALKNGSELAWTGFDPAYQAYLNMDVAFRDAEGMSIPVAQEGLMPTQLLTKQTIGSTTNWTAPTDAKAQFLKLWNLH